MVSSRIMLKNFMKSLKNGDKESNFILKVANSLIEIKKSENRIEENKTIIDESKMEIELEEEQIEHIHKFVKEESRNNAEIIKMLMV